MSINKLIDIRFSLLKMRVQEEGTDNDNKSNLTLREGAEGECVGIELLYICEGEKTSVAYPEMARMKYLT